MLQRSVIDADACRKAALTIGDHDIGELSGGGLAPPLVSFVVICWNYARHVGAAIQSIRQQDYPHFECLVIDNGSTDDSTAVIARHIAGDRRFTSVTLPENLGQLGAAFWSLERIRGGFVTFVDADDVLFRNYASNHLQAHMALKPTVAFTSSNVAEMNAAGEALSSGNFMANAKRPYPAPGLQPAASVIRIPAVSDGDYARLSAGIVLVPKDEWSWVWGPGTANMYRASILKMIRLGDGDRRYMRSADGYFNTVCQALGGSALIGMNLSAYRIHGANYFARLEKMPTLRSGTRQYAEDSAAAVHDAVELLLCEADRFGWLLGKSYFAAIDQVTRSGARWRDLRRFYRGKRAYRLFLAHAPQLRASFGSLKLGLRLAARFSPWRTACILRAAFATARPSLPRESI